MPLSKMAIIQNDRVFDLIIRRNIFLLRLLMTIRAISSCDPRILQPIMTLSKSQGEQTLGRKRPDSYIISMM